MEEFSIDGLRLDVAYLLDENFMRRLHSYVRQRDEGFFLLGEMIHGDYKRMRQRGDAGQRHQLRVLQGAVLQPLTR